MATYTSNISKSREVARERFGDVVEQVRTPLLAALGAGDLATQAVADLLNKARAQVDRGTAKPATPADVAQLRDKLDAAELNKLVDPRELRKLVDPGELRDLVDAYAKAANDLYRYLAEQGEGALDKLREQPQVAKALDQLEDAVNQAQGRIGDAAGDARELADEVLSRVTFRARSTGEKAANRVTEAAQETAEALTDAAQSTAKTVTGAAQNTAEAVTEAADDAADAVTKAGAKAASESRSAGRKVAAKTDPKPANATKPSTPRKSTDK